ncbi:MAG: alpha-2-macroglobulin, partial [Bacteroidales bacterium]|nr:alpha-2-macroglobulin [Bacteroidales bacterium]
LVDWPWEYGMKNNADGATLLSLSADREKYKPGDDISITFPSMENATAIVTVENSTEILDEIRHSTTGATTEVSFKATPEMAPNVYACVSLIQPHSQTVNDMPVRLYGVIPIMVEDPQSRLNPRITVPDEIRSQKPFEIRISEASKKEMTYTLAIVDEGLLDITGFTTPDPWDHFFAREALGVQTWDMYDNVLGVFGGTLNRILAVGGDEALTDITSGKAQRFVPVVRFSGPYTLNEGKTNVHSFTLPQYTGSVRTMVVAGNDMAYGKAEKAVTVRDPLMVLVTAPRVISPGEKASLPVTVFVQKEGIKEIAVSAEGNDLIIFENHTLTLDAGGTGEYDTEFVFEAAGKTGTGKIKITASSGGETASYDLVLNVRSPNPHETRSELKILNQGEQWISSFTPFGIEGSNSAVLQISGLPSVNLEKRLDYLQSYPYGCTEQITSAAFPQIWLQDLYRSDPSVASGAAVNIKKALTEIASRQLQNGGILPWPGHYQPDNWITSYTGHFMMEAERKGYVILPGVFEKWISYQEKTARDWRPDPAHPYYANDQAYRLFTLALAGLPDRGAMNRLRESGNMPAPARWLLAASFATTGRPEAATELLDIRNTATEPDFYPYYYGSELRDKAIVLYTLLLLKDYEQALPFLNEICENLNSETWFSTQSVAWALFSYMKWTETIPSDDNKALVLKTIINGNSSEVRTGAGEAWKTGIDIMKGKNTITVENNSRNPAYINLVRKGIPASADGIPVVKGLSMNVRYTDMDINPVDHKDIPRGTDFMMIVSVTNTSMTNLSNLALTQMVASGWEIRNTRLFESDYGFKESLYEYRDIRDDSMITFFSLTAGETKTFPLVLNAAYKGDYLQPSLWCEAMYSDSYYAKIPGTMVKVSGE